MEGARPEIADAARLPDKARDAAAVQDGAPVNNGDGTETVVFRDTVPRGSAPRFIRLKVAQP